jgi:RNA polymerase sigma-70 factor (ECF subfamily)
MQPGDTHHLLVEQFERSRAHLQAVAFRMLGSSSEADDAVQEAWLRLNHADTSGVENMGGWLTTIVARVCLDMLRARTARREESLDAQLSESLVSRAVEADPEQEALLADSVGLALLVVLDTLAPAERLAFVLHDILRGALRPDCANCGAFASSGSEARKSRTSSYARSGHRCRHRPRPPANHC